MIERLRTLTRDRRHPRPQVFSAYLDGELDGQAREALETHVRECPRCRRVLGSLAGTVRALGSIRLESRPGLADSIIEALRADSRPEVPRLGRAPDGAGLPALTVVSGSGEPSAAERIPYRRPQGALAALRYCLQRPQLRLTVPITAVTGIVLSLVNMGGTLLRGRIDVGVCLMCTSDFLVPFVALNLGLLMVLRVPGRRRA